MSTISKFLALVPNGFSTQIASATVAADALSVNLDATTDLPTEGVGQFFKKDANGEVVAGSVEFVHWTNVSGNTITFSDTDDRGIPGSDSGAQAYVADDYFEVWASSYYTSYGGLVEHGSDGKHTAELGQDLKLATGVNIQVNSADPFRTIVIPAGAMSPTTTAGCADVATVEAGTNDVDYKVLDFDKATEENAFCVFAMPDSWDGGTITATFIWTSTVTSGDVIWGIKGRAFANDDAIDQAYGTAVTVTDTAIASGDVHISSATGAMTFAGTPAGGQLVQIKVYRDADDGGDTADADARLIAVKIEYSVGQYSD
jgi:hypothetical protein